jgi:hypothetical protein
MTRTRLAVSIGAVLAVIGVVATLATTPEARAQAAPPFVVSFQDLAEASAQAWAEGLLAPPPGNGQQQVTATFTKGRLEFRRKGEGSYRTLELSDSTIDPGFAGVEIRRGLAVAQYLNNAVIGKLKLRTINTRGKTFILCAQVLR